MNKVYVLPPGEGWIVDRFVNEWNIDNADISVSHPRNADVIWLMADWCWDRLATAGLLTGKRVITTIHHVVPEKFGPSQAAEFARRDLVTDVYHVPNRHTREFIEKLTTKPIVTIPYWANNKIWQCTGTREELRKKHGLPEDGYIIGSFQRDTEGHDLKSPKLEKGPDLFCNYINSKTIVENNVITFNGKPVHILLAGWRRQYVISRLKEMGGAPGVPHTYFERQTQSVLNELYQTLDLYPVTARYEGGPQALIECGLLGIPCISRPVGMSYDVLPPEAISYDLLFARPTAPNVEKLKLPQGYEPYRKLIEAL